MHANKFSIICTRKLRQTRAYHIHAKSPIRTVIVSQGDVSDFHQIQGVVGDLIASESRMSVFISHHPRENPRANYLLFFDKHRGRVVI